MTATVPDILKVARDVNSRHLRYVPGWYGIAAILYASIVFALIWGFRKMEIRLLAYLKPQGH